MGRHSTYRGVRRVVDIEQAEPVYRSAQGFLALARFHRRHLPLNAKDLAAVANLTTGSASDRQSRRPLGIAA